MTTELEQKFFEAFDIQKIFKTTINIGDLDTNYEEIQAPTLKELYEKARFDLDTPIYFSWFKRSKRWSEEYPQITDRHYLELIVLLSGVCCMNFAFERSLDEMKYKILKITMEFEKIFKHQVQAIFRGENE